MSEGILHIPVIVYCNFICAQNPVEISFYFYLQPNILESCSYKKISAF